MSSRGIAVGSGPRAGTYQSHPVPFNLEDLPAYINDELLVLGGHVNDIKSGGALPPTSEMPQRYSNGMMVYFVEVIEPFITTPGIWLYKSDQWVKLADNPSIERTNLSVYLRSDSVPNPPPEDKYNEVDISPWTYTVPEGEPIWISVAANADLGVPTVNWSTPRQFKTSTFSGWFYGSMTAASWTGSFPSDASSRFQSSVGRDPVEGDLFTLIPESSVEISPKIVTGYFDGSSWVEPNQIIDGSLIPPSTIDGSSIKPDTVISSPQIVGGSLEEVTVEGTVSGDFTGSITDSTIEIDSTTSEYFDKNFSLKADGSIEADSASFGNLNVLDELSVGGELVASPSDGLVVSKNFTFRDGVSQKIVKEIAVSSSEGVGVVSFTEFLSTKDNLPVCSYNVGLSDYTAVIEGEIPTVYASLGWKNVTSEDEEGVITLTGDIYPVLKVFLEGSSIDLSLFVELKLMNIGVE